VWIPFALQGLGQDVRQALRSLWANRIVSGVAILSLALGIGANTAIFSLVNGLFLRALPVRESGRLTLLVEPPNFESVPMPLSYAVWNQFRRGPDLFGSAAIWASTSLNTAALGEAELADAILASGSFFDVLGVPAMVGRIFSDTDDPDLPGRAD